MSTGAKLSLTARLHAILWGAFSLGGFISAFLLPVLIYVNNVAYPLRLWPATSMDPASLLLLGRVSALLVLLTIAGSLYHGMFRFVATLPELGIARFKEKIAAIGYAIVGTGIVMLLIYVLNINRGLLSFP